MYRDLEDTKNVYHNGIKFLKWDESMYSSFEKVDKGV